MARSSTFPKEAGFLNGRRLAIATEVSGRFWSVGAFVLWSEESGNFIAFVMDGSASSDRMSVASFEGSSQLASIETIVPGTQLVGVSGIQTSAPFL